jgi:hypothetical protein
MRNTEQTSKKSKTSTASKKISKVTSYSGRHGLLGFIDRIGTPAAVIFGLTIGIGIWSWLAYVVQSPQDVNTFGFIFLGVNVLGAAAQMSYIVFFQKTGTVRERVTLEAGHSSRQGSSVIFWGPAVIFGIVFLLVTPPGTSATAIEYGWNIYQAIGLFTMLSILAAAIGSLLLYVLVVIPVALIINGLLPPEKEESRSANSVPIRPISRTESLCMGLIIVAIVTFAVDMQFISPAKITTHFSRQAMGEQFMYFVTLHGDLVATIIGVLSIVVIVVLGIINNKAVKRRRDAWRSSVIDTAKVAKK